jgi:hypothetical protein
VVTWMWGRGREGEGEREVKEMPEVKRKQDGKG